MSKVRPIYLYICLTLIVLAGAAFVAFKSFSAAAEPEAEEYNGQESPGIYTISTLEQLEQLVNKVNNDGISYEGTTFKLTGNIDLTEKYKNNADSWIPIGVEKEKPFSGTFDGGKENGYKITGLYVDIMDGQPVSSKRSFTVPCFGLFGYVDGVVQNLNLNGEIMAEDILGYSSGSYTGGIVGYNNGTIKECEYNGVIVTIKDTEGIGGIAGYNAGTIDHCMNTGEIKMTYLENGSPNEIGGIVGVNEGAVKECTNTGRISGETNRSWSKNISFVGGIAGSNDTVNSTIEGCTNSGDISIKLADSTNFTVQTIGGIVGGALAEIKDCHNKGNITIEIEGGTAYCTYIGGIVGGNSQLIIKNPGAAIKVTGCTNTGRIKADNGQDVGGITGGLGSNSRSIQATIADCVNEGTVQGSSRVGGIAGYCENTAISICYNRNGVTAEQGDIGGVVGELKNGTISDCANVGNISGTNYVGGIVGIVSEGSPENCYNIGTVTGDSNVGGAVGSGAAVNCYYLDTENDGEKKTSAEFASGEVTWLLQNGQDEFIWGQILPGDKYPLLRVFDNTAERVWKVTFMDEDGDTELAVKYVNNGNAVTEPDDVVKQGFTVEWYTDPNGENKYDFDDNVTDDTILYAKWTCDHSNDNWSDWTHNADGHSRECMDCGVTVSGEHEYGEWRNDDADYHIRECIVCEGTEKAEHNWDRDNGEVTAEPSCTEMGTTTYPCIDRCGATHDEIDVDMTDHVFDGEWIEDTDGEGHHKECVNCGTPSESFSHDWDEGTLTPGNCTTESRTDFVCLSCGAEKTEYGEIVPEVHDWHDNGYDEEGHHLECSRCHIKKVSDHIWDEGTVDIKPTCVSVGSMILNCTVAGCNETKTVELHINPDAHKWSSEWDSDENEHRHICENGCGKTYSADHMWNNGETTKEPTCTEAGEITFTCTECGYSRIEAAELLGHDFSEAWSFDENGHWHECSRDNVKDEITAHTETSEVTTQPTPTEDGLTTYSCEVCGYVIRTEVIPATGTNTPPTDDDTPSIGGSTPPTGGNTPPASGRPSTGGTSVTPVNSDNQTTNTDNIVRNSDELLDAVTAADDGGTVKAAFNTDSVTIGKEVFEAAAKKDVTLEIQLKDIYWTIDGKDIEKSREVDLGASRKNKAIPMSEIKAVAGDDPYVPLLLEHDGEFGFKGILNIPIDGYDGKYANLYYYTNGRLGILGHSKISEGYMRFAFRHASDYLIVIGDQPYGEDISFDIGSYNSEDVSSAAGLHEASEMLDDIVPENRASVTVMIVPIGVIIAFIVNKRLRASK